MPQRKCVVVTGGGTAGHVVPSLPVIERLLEDDIHVCYVGSKSGLEQQLVNDLDVDFYSITTGKLRRYFSAENVLDAFRVFAGIWQAFKLVRRLRPVVVFSKGGYVAFPVVVGSWLNRVPVVVHESDVSPGLANRLSLPFLKTLCVNFPSVSIRAKRTLITGTPVRPALMNGNSELGRDQLGVETGAKILLIVGGSLGAVAINEVVRESLTELCDEFFVVHICGAGNVDHSFDSVRYRQFEFITEGWGDVLAAADLVISRAGANTLYELLALRKRNILIPLSRKASRGDQVENAAMSEAKGWSFTLQEETLTKETLLRAIGFVQRDTEYWQRNLESFEIRDSVSLIYEELARVARRQK